MHAAIPRGSLIIEKFVRRLGSVPIRNPTVNAQYTNVRIPFRSGLGFHDTTHKTALRMLNHGADSYLGFLRRLHLRPKVQNGRRSWP